jgi:cell wall-associated NlpC family hydrolase
MEFFKEKSLKHYLIAGAVVLAIVAFTVTIVATVKANATEEYWDVKIGDETVAVLTSESSAKQVIKNVKNYYVTDGAQVKSIKCSPAMTVEQKSYKVSQKPEISQVEDAVDYILTGTKTPVTYTVKSGDTAWDIAEANGFSVRELVAMNEDVDVASLYPGDELKLYKTEPMVVVTTVQVVTSEKSIGYKTVTKSSSEYLKNTTVVKQKGSYGKKTVTEVVTSENGVVTDTEVQSSTVTKKAKNKIVIKGTGTLSAPSSGTTYEGSGSDVANYALQYVGNPYVYGGSSLTSGADCSGFVLAVYSHFGITMAHDADAMRSYGREVSLSEAQPGDLICYSGHIGIYIGGGQLVHAVNERLGIAVTSTGYVGSVISVRRIVE